MTKMQFVAAATRVQEEDAEDVAGEEPEAPKILEFSIGGQDFEATVPTTTQIILLSSDAGEGTLRSIVTASMTFLEGILIGDGFKRLRKLIASGVVSHSLLIGGDDANEQGIVDWIVSQVSDGRPPQPSTDSSPSPKSTGARSTGRAPGKGSIQSASPSGGS